MNMRLIKTNPNNTCGGGGCLCHELTHPDQAGPYIIFPENEMENPLSPHAVMCAPCVEKAFELLDEADEALQAGEIDAIAVEED